MTEEIIPNDGRAININSSTAKSIIEGVVPKAIRTWTVFKNTDNTLEGIEALAFAMWQVALDEIEKESDNVVFMSDNTVKLITDTLKHLEQENKKLSFAIEKCLENAGIECDDEEQALRSLPMLGNAHHKVLVEKEELEQENKELKEKLDKEEYNACCECTNIQNQNDKYRSALEEIKKKCNWVKDCSVTNDNMWEYDEILEIINEVLQCE